MKIYLISRFLLFFFKGERQSETEVRTEGIKVVLRDTFPTWELWRSERWKCHPLFAVILANAPGDIAYKCLQLKCHNCVYTELPFKTAYDDVLSKFQFMQSGVCCSWPQWFLWAKPENLTHCKWVNFSERISYVDARETFSLSYYRNGM